MSSMQPQIRVGDVDSILRMTIREMGVPLDVSSASVKTLKLKPPSGVVLTKTLVFTSGGADGRVQYTTVAGDINQAGPWVGQVYIEMGAQKFHTTQFGFQVGDNL